MMPPTKLSRSLQPLQLLSYRPRTLPRTYLLSTQSRLESTYRRQARRLSIPPAPSFTNAPNGSLGAPNTSHVIFNPPSSAPNIYHTPLKFLPPGDRRRPLYASASSMHNIPSPSPSRTKPSSIPSPFAKPGTQLHESSSTLPHGLRPSIPERVPLPPALKEGHVKKYHLGPAEIAEMKKLREENPRYWSRVRLAKKFDCSAFFVSITAKNEEMGLEHQRRNEEARKRWGPRKRAAKNDRVRRRELWGRDA